MWQWVLFIKSAYAYGEEYKIVKEVINLLQIIFKFVGNLCRLTDVAVEEELEKLKTSRQFMQARLDDVENRWRIVDLATKHWLGELKFLCFDIEDLMEEYETKATERPTSVIHFWFLIYWIWYKSSVLARISDITKRQNSLKENRDQNRAVTNSDGSLIPAREDAFLETGSLERIHEIRGRDEEKKKLRELLEAVPANNNHSYPDVISIEGEWGIGKTTLAQWAYNHPPIKFSLRIWLSFPRPDPNSTKIIKDVIEQIINPQTESNDATFRGCNLSTLDMLQQKLKQLVSKEKFLLVLDGVWDFTFWETLRAPLFGLTGSKVLVTTRNHEVSRYMNPSASISLTGLDARVLSEILENEAFPQGNCPMPPSLKPIVEGIAGKCNGCPLLANILGKSLHNEKEEEEWKNLHNSMSSLSPETLLLGPQMLHSYELISLELKRCFLYCAVFPKGYEFDRDDLVKLWVSQRLVKNENHGRNIFKRLLDRSFFQLCDNSNNNNSNNNMRVIMPGLIPYLAQSISKYEFFKVDSSIENQDGLEHEEFRRARYASICGHNVQKNLVEYLYKKKYIRTLIIYDESRVPVDIIQPKHLIKKLSFLRALDLSYNKIKNLPKSIQYLIHLRYLNLRGSSLVNLPESLCMLSKLQTLELADCWELKELPKGMSKLVNLRHLGLVSNWEAWNGEDLDSMPPKMGELTSLQTLSKFTVSEENSCGIAELANLRKLRGELCISKLENVRDASEATRAKLHDKYIEFLILKWSDKNGKYSERKDRVISNLCPTKTIKNIWIEGFSGSKFPDWMNFEDPLFTKLESIKLSKCNFCVKLPQLGNLPRLRKLYIQGLNSVHDLNDLLPESGDIVGFISLEYLHLSDLPELTTWFDLPNHGLKPLNNLSKLIISNCPSLRNIKSTLPALSDLVVEQSDPEIIEWIQNLTSLTSLSILNVPMLEFIVHSHLRPLIGLRRLKVYGCEDLVYFPQFGHLKYLSSLKTVQISSCPKLETNLCEDGRGHWMQT